MAASLAEEASSSCIPPKCVYDIFLSFSGVDTRKNFTGHLLAALGRHGFCTFRDDKELIRGEYISDGLLKAIETSTISVIVFSKKYAESRWCLDELVKIMDCRKTLKQIVLPVFYDIDPSDVRGQKGSVELAFAKHEERFKDGLDVKVQKWREALTDAANLSGWDSQNVANGDEAEFIKIIVEEVGKKIHPMHLDVADHQVGLESRLQKLNVLLSMESNDVRIVGIWGIGGIGKTTIAKMVYNRIQCKFEGSSFLADVRETWNRINGTVVLQEQLLSDIFGNGAPKIKNVHQGIAVIKQRALCRKVLLVLDDVDDYQQLKELAIGREWFGSGSRIIITTRNRSLLYSVGVGENEIYAPEELNKDESLELFSWHAFKKDHPIQDHFELSDQVVHSAGGNPLALEVLGSLLFRTRIADWKSAMAKLSQIPHPRIQGILKISFDSLSMEQRELFLDIACFFVGMDRDFTIKILEGCNTFVAYQIGVLADRCLIKSGQYNNQFTMHDMIRDMGREIVRQESPEPGRRSRLWYHEDVLGILRDGTGTDKVKGLLLNVAMPINVQVNKTFEKMNRLWYDENVLEVRRDGMGTDAVEGRLLNVPEPKVVHVNGKSFERMNRLWLLHLNYVHVTGGYEHISKSLVWLCWNGFPLECVPSNLSMENLVSLDLCYSSFKQVWKGTKVMSKLKFLYLSHCDNLAKTPNFSGLNNLEELFLNGCERLVEVDESITRLKKLVVLDMKHCNKLQKLPSAILMLKSLESLDLSGCSKLEHFARFEGSPSKSLWSFLLPWTLRTKNVDSIGLSLASVQGLSCLKRLIMAYCNVSYLPSEIGRLISLEELDLRGNNLRSLPDSICYLTCLKDLDLSRCNVSHLPSKIGSLISLKKLNLRGNNLRTLPDSICYLTYMNYLDLSGCNMTHLPSEIGALISLETFSLEGNNIRILPDSICKQSCLKILNLKDCCVSHLPTEIGGLLSLETLNLGGNELCTLPESICDLSCLKNLYLDGCNVSHLPTEIGRLSSLETLSLERNSLCALPDSVCNLTRLGYLSLKGCNVSQLPSEIGSLVSLVGLHLVRNSLCTLPDSICKLIRLDGLYLEGCNLSELPSEIGKLVPLRDLDLQGNNFRTLPDSISNLTRLGYLNLNNCARLQSLPRLPASRVYAQNCTSLESIPIESDRQGLTMVCDGCNKLAENNFANNFRKRLYQNEGLSPLRNSFNIVLPAGGDVPNWFQYQSIGSCLSFVVPHLLNQKIFGWILCVLFMGHDREVDRPNWLSLDNIICCQTIKRFNRQYLQYVRTTSQDQMWLIYSPLSYLGLQLQGGDEVEIPIQSSDASILVKMCGINLIYEV